MKKHTKQWLVTAVAAAMPFISQASFSYTQSVDEIANNPLVAYQTVYLGMPRSDFDINFSILPDWTFYGNTATTEEWAERSTGDGVNDVTESIKITTANSTKNGRVLAFENSFATKNKTIAKDIYNRLVATIYSNMENFPHRQQGQAVTWVENDVTIVVSYDGKKDEKGLYKVCIRRYNNRVLTH